MTLECGVRRERRLNCNERPRLTPLQRAHVGKLVRDHGITSKDCYEVEVDVIDCPLLRISCYIRADDGYLVVDPFGRIRTETVEVAQRTPLPAWWQPDRRERSP